ncbi:MAG: hypothetical protein JXK94_13795 [Deltaproteobacteria bacterium]|nr:hypothetical protein [Deltaproteobacteria bacterium]
MAKYGRGLNRELVAAVNSGLISEPFAIRDVKHLVREKGWHPEVSDKYINVALVNGSSERPSPTYKKYFTSVGQGLYVLKNQFKGDEWL